MSFYWPTLSGQNPVVPAFVFVCSWAGGIFAGCCVDVAGGFVVSKIAVLLVSNVMAMVREKLTAVWSCAIRWSRVSFCLAVTVVWALLVLPPPPLLSPPMEVRADLISARIFLASLCWILADRVRWSSVPWTISLPCVSAFAKLPKWASKLLAKFAPWGRMQVSPWNGVGLASVAMLWTSWAADAAPKKSSPLTRRVLRSMFLWRGLKVSFQDLHVWSDFGFLSHSGRSLGK